MRITDLDCVVRDGWRRLQARVAFEEVERDSLTVFFEARAEIGDDLELTADPFVMGLLPAASWHGEPRLFVEGAMCPVLRGNLQDHVRVLAGWYACCAETELETSTPDRVRYPRTPRRRGLFFSGGVDAMATLRRNRLDLPPDHPDSIREGITIYGTTPANVPGGEIHPARFAEFERFVDGLREFGRLADLPILLMRTNLICAYDEPRAWGDAGWGAATAAVAHALGPRFTDVDFASSGAGPFHVPHGSHALLDDRLGSSRLRIHPGLAYRTRFERVRLLAGWPEALAGVRPCLAPLPMRPEEGNCGTCEKCLRTMLALEACGALERASAFPRLPLDPDRIRRFRLPKGRELLLGEDMAVALEGRGRADLAGAVREAMADAGLSRRRRRLHRWRRRLLSPWRGGCR